MSFCAVGYSAAFNTLTMRNPHTTYAKVLLIGALAFSFAAEAAHYTFADAPASSLKKAASQDTMQQWQKKLLGPYANIDMLSAYNLRSAYISLLEHAHAQHSGWSDADWQQAKAVLDKMDSKKGTLESQLTLDDKAKIKVMQAEFRALETAGNVRD